MMRSIVLFACLTVSYLCQAQTPSAEYYLNISRADSLYTAKDYAASAVYYTKAFHANGGKGVVDDRYNAACTWALAGNPDSAFFQLNRIVTVMTNLGHVSIDADLTSLHTDKRWKPFLAHVKKNKEKAEVNLNRPLARELDSIYTEDQKYRQKIAEVEKEHGFQSPQMQDLWKVIMKRDSANLIRVTAILDQYGWLGRDVVGIQGNMTLFLVIQHSNQATQEKYLPMMREAVKKGNAQGANLALLEDRVALGQGKKQIYGSQIHQEPSTGKYFVAPIEDEANVNKRRAEVGLEPLEKYAKRWNIDYKLPVK